MTESAPVREIIAGAEQAATGTLKVDITTVLPLEKSHRRASHPRQRYRPRKDRRRDRRL